MKKTATLLAIVWLILVLGVLSSCGDKVKEVPNEAWQGLLHNEVVNTRMDYAFSFGNFVKSGYNEVGNPVFHAYYTPTTMQATPLSFRYHYNDNGKLIDVVMGEGDDALMLSVSYNKKGYPTSASSKVDGNRLSIHFTCDDDGRIVSESLQYDGAIVAAYEYDKDCRIVKESGSSHEGSYEIVTAHSGAVSAAIAKYMGESAFSLTITYDASGYPVAMTGVVDGVEPWQYTDGLATWAYNEKNLCTEFSMHADGKIQTVTYEYDAKGELIKKTVSKYDADGNPIT